jgi:hypothetical protein
MARMPDLIRQAAVPDDTLRQAAAGTLPLPPSEMVEVLVLLANHPRFGETARSTLAQRGDEDQLRPVVADPNAAKEVLNYFLTHRRPELMMDIISNPAVTDATVAVVAETASRSLLELMLQNERVLRSPDIMVGLAANPELFPAELQTLKERLKTQGKDLADTGEVFDYEWALWIMDHAAEIAAEESKVFNLVDATEEEKLAAAGKAAAEAEDPERISTITKIARMSVGQRVQLAMKGTKDERFVLIRDGSKMVALAVLESPKVSDGEVESFAAMKNVQEDVLRGIGRKRKFMKNYGVVRALVNNPRTPLDQGLTLVNYLMTADLKALSMNKNVADTIRKVALKYFREKTGGR